MSTLAPATTTLKNAFLEQVELRLSILERWIGAKAIPWKTGPGGEVVRDKDGELVPDFVPTNLHQFCDWVPEMNSLASDPDIAKLRTVSRETLYKEYHADLRKRVDAKYKAAKVCLKHQLENKNKTSIIEQLEAQVTLLNGIVEAQQTESRLARQRLGEATTQYRKRHNEQRRLITQLKTDLAEKDQKIAELTAQLSTLSPLRRVPPKELKQ